MESCASEGEAVRKLVVTQNITVDGSIEMLGDWFDPQGQGDQADLVEELRRQDSSADAFVTGRQTFEALRGYWPQQSQDATGISEYLNSAEVRCVLDYDRSAVAELHRPLRRPRPGDRRPEGAARSGHRRHRQHHALPHPDHRGTGRRVPLVRLSRCPRPRKADVPGWLRVSQADAARGEKLP